MRTRELGKEGALRGLLVPSGEPFREASMDQRMRFIADHQRGLYAMTEFCARNGISRKTEHKWLTGYASDGARGPAQRSHAPHVCQHRIRSSMPSSTSTTLSGRTRLWARKRRPAATRRQRRPYPARLPVLEYAGHFLVKHVTDAGTFRTVLLATLDERDFLMRG